MLFGCGSNVSSYGEVRIRSKYESVANNFNKLFYDEEVDLEFKIYCTNLCKKLTNYSMSNKKNKTMKLPNINFKEDFIAGYIEHSCSLKDLACYVSGNFDILNDINNYLNLGSKITKNSNCSTCSMYIKRADWNNLKSKLNFKEIKFS